MPIPGIFKALAKGARLTAPSSALEHKVPDGERVYAVGDVHGRSDLLRQLIGHIRNDLADFAGTIQVVFIGDYIDRGPDSAGVMDMLMRDIPSAWNAVFLRGNHEEALGDFLAEPRRHAFWLSWGGTQALESYGIPAYGLGGLRAPEALAAELRFALEERGHMPFLEKLELYHTIGGYAFVHAGVRAGIPLEKQLRSDILFIREDFMGRPHGLPYRVIFGHTILPTPLVENDRIGIDTGAFQSGVLTCAVLEGSSVRFLQTS